MDIIGRNNIKEKSEVKITMSISLALIIITWIGMNYYKNTASGINHDTLGMITQILNSILGIASTITGLFYYTISKKEDILIMSMIFMSISIDIVMFYIDMATVGINSIDTFVLCNYIIRSGLVLLTIVPTKKIKSIIFYNKNIFLTLILAISLILNRFENNRDILINIKTPGWMIIFTAIGIILYLIAAIIFMRKSVIKRDYSDMIIGFAYVLFLLRGLGSIVAIVNNSYDFKSYLNGIVIVSICYIILTFHLCYDISKQMRKITKLKDDFGIFYNISENNQFNRILICDENSKIIYINNLIRDKYRNVYGNNTTKEEIINVLNKLSKHACKEEKENICKCLDRSGCWEGILNIPNSDEITYCAIQQSYTSYNKKIYKVSLRDDTEKYKLHRKIEDNEHKLRLLMDNTSELITMSDRNGIVTYVNKAVVDRMEYSEDEIIGQSIYTDTSREHIVTEELRTRNEVISLYNVINKSGEKIKLESIKSTIYNKNGEIDGYICIARDTEYTEALENLRVKYDEMLYHQQTKNEFFASLSHELKTPLNIFYSIIQLLDKRSEVDEHDFKAFYKQYNNGLKVNFYRMFRLINNLIDITKLESGFIEPKFENRDIINIVENITLSVIPFANEKNINIIFDTEEEESYIKFDAESIERIMLNLLSNAIKFTDVGGNIDINIEVNKEWVRIIVRDDGIGIPENMQKSIFEKFVQVDKPSHRKNEGSGMGLSIVKSLIDLHDGKIELESYDNKGSKFTIWIPNEALDIIDMNHEETVYNIDSNRIRLELSDICDAL
ncbi:PAS domain S-box protein [Romboutsia weinsteinii]|uniref:histidine kinase n=1 Tax=Romboutsia weinsteinii TaxID=2020949 RepID=A0A371IZZ0_9FIRM|nr:ATP-binding protein [Romboutsia weinsteinii]RDY25987.1 PAS domain S-box protein [Romboutsia weinsteinii]